MFCAELLYNDFSLSYVHTLETSLFKFKYYFKTGNKYCRETVYHCFFKEFVKEMFSTGLMLSLLLQV